MGLAVSRATRRHVIAWHIPEPALPILKFAVCNALKASRRPRQWLGRVAAPASTAPECATVLAVTRRPATPSGGLKFARHQGDTEVETAIANGCMLFTRPIS